MDDYVVYKHTSPDGKVYIGITRRNVIERWGKNGEGYKGNKHFWRAIQKYGWNSFQHEILYSELSKEDACQIEIEYIKKFNSNDFRFGYNICAGGEGRLEDTQSAETRKKISEATKNQWNDSEIRERHRQGSLGHVVSQEARNKIRESQIGKYVPPEVGRKISKAKKGKHPWNYGKKCGSRSEEVKKKISETLRKRYSNDI